MGIEVKEKLWMVSSRSSIEWWMVELDPRRKIPFASIHTKIMENFHKDDHFTHWKETWVRITWRETHSMCWAISESLWTEKELWWTVENNEKHLSFPRHRQKLVQQTHRNWIKWSDARKQSENFIWLEEKRKHNCR